jgi:PAS domain-containing protein
MTTTKEPARLVLDGVGRILDATPAAERLLGADLAALRAAPPGAFSPEPSDEAADAAFRDGWQAGGSNPIVGRATVRRPDGSLQRVRYLIVQRPDAGFEAVLEPVDEAVTERPTAVVLGQVLEAWRAAERRLERLAPGSLEARDVEAEVEALRARYQDLFRLKRAGADG